MPKKKIAIDIDDVLAASTEALRLVVNNHLGVDLSAEDYRTPGQYWNYYEQVWHKHGLGNKITLEELNPQMERDQSHIKTHENAIATLEKLAKQYLLIVVTARNHSWESATKDWLASNFPDVFSEVLFAGRYGDSNQPKTKGEICAEHNVSWLIDDNVEHGKDATNNGVNVILFGSYGWHLDIPKDMIRCEDWLAVAEFFNEKK